VRGRLLSPGERRAENSLYEAERRKRRGTRQFCVRKRDKKRSKEPKRARRKGEAGARPLSGHGNECQYPGGRVPIPNQREEKDGQPSQETVIERHLHGTLEEGMGFLKANLGKGCPCMQKGLEKLYIAGGNFLGAKGKDLAKGRTHDYLKPLGQLLKKRGGKEPRGSCSSNPAVKGDKVKSEGGR